MNMPKRTDRVSELENLYNNLIKYHTFLLKHLGDSKLAKDEKEKAADLLLNIQRKVGYLGKLINELTGLEKVDVGGKEYDMWVIALKIPPDKLAFSALGHCIQVTNRAIGKLRDDIDRGIRDKQGNIIEKQGKMAKPAVKVEQKDTTGSPIQLFNALQLHPRIIRASKSLFNSGHYAEAIFAAFKAVNNFTKRKVDQPLDGKDLMAKAFNEDKPIIKINKLTSRSERDEQEGFRFLFMGAMVGIRNPKAHDDIRQINPYKTLEYLAFASLLMRRATEGKLEPKNK